MKLCKDESKIPVVNSKERKKIITCPMNNLSGETSHLVTLLTEKQGNNKQQQ